MFGLTGSFEIWIILSVALLLIGVKLSSMLCLGMEEFRKGLADGKEQMDQINKMDL